MSSSDKFSKLKVYNTFARSQKKQDTVASRDPLECHATGGSLEEQSDGDGVITNPWQLASVCFGLILAIAIAAVDETIVATALGAIVAEFNAPDQAMWVASAYLLTMTACTPLYGKFSDIFGRRACLIFALSTFLVGSLLSGAATSMTMVIIFRAISGIGAGGLMALPLIIISDIVTIENRGAYLSLINATFAVANVVGPLVGGFLVDQLSWRWVFYINGPIVIVASITILFFLNLNPNQQQQSTGEGISSKLQRIDIGGTLALIGGISLVVLGLNWGGSRSSNVGWGSPSVVACLVVGLLILAGFVIIESKFAMEPIVPGRIFNTNVSLCLLIELCIGFPMFLYIYHWPLFFQTVKGSSATEAGLELLPVLLGVCGCSAVSGLLINRFKSYRPMMWLGMGLVLVGSLMMFRLDGRATPMTRFEELVYPLLTGVGIGLNIQSCIIAAQVASDKGDLAVTTGLLPFSLNIGGVLGLSLYGAILSTTLIANLTRLLPHLDPQLIAGSLDYLNQLAPEDYHLAIAAYRSAYSVMFASLSPLALIGLLASLRLHDIPLTALPPVPAH